MERQILESYVNRFAILARATSAGEGRLFSVFDVFERTEELKRALEGIQPKAVLSNIQVEMHGRNEKLTDIIQAVEVYQLEMAFFVFLGAYSAFFQRASCALFLLSEGVIANYNKIFNSNPQIDMTLYKVMAELYGVISEGCRVMGDCENERRIFMKESKKLFGVVEKMQGNDAFGKNFNTRTVQMVTVN